MPVSYIYIAEELRNLNLDPGFPVDTREEKTHQESFSILGLKKKYVKTVF